MSSEPKSNVQPSGATRCVVVCPPDSGADPRLPDELSALLGARATVLNIETDPVRAMSYLVIHERAFLRAEHKDPMLLLLVEPARIPRCELLVAAASKYAPHAPVWQYVANAAKRLSRYVSPSEIPAGIIAPAPGVRPPQPRPAPTTPTAPRGVTGPSGFVSWAGLPRAAPAPAAPRPAPKLRLAGEAAPQPTGGDDPAKPAAPASIRPGVTLTDEEMRMLLNGDHEPATSTRAPVNPR